MTEQTDVVLLSSLNGDFGLVHAHNARDQAQQLANAEGVTVYMRGPTTDEIIDTVEPQLNVCRLPQKQRVD